MAYLRPAVGNAVAEDLTRRKADVDPAPLQALLVRAFGSSTRVTFARTPDGVSTQVYRIGRGEQVFYLRVAEEGDQDLGVDAALFCHLRGLGVRVPDVIYVESFDPRIGQSVMITTEIPGTLLASGIPADAAARIAQEAGRDLALVNQVPVHGFGWVLRDHDAWPLSGGLSSYGDFVTSYLPKPRPGDLGLLFSASELNAIEAIIETESARDLGQGRLAHGAFDVTAILQYDGLYTGIIDFGEIRGAEPTFDLGHFDLHDGEIYPSLLFESLIAGYREVADLPQDYLEQVRRSAILLGLRQLCRWISPERGRQLEHPSVRYRSGRLRELLAHSPA